MAVAKTIEIIAGSTTSFDDAVRGGIAKASETVNNIHAAWVQDTKVEVSGGQVTEWRVTLKVTFVVK